jgi:hypothetical protein
MSEAQLKQVLRKSGRYYQSPGFFYHRLWRQHLRQLGFYVASVEKRSYADCWHIRVRITSSSQLNLLVSSAPAPKRPAGRDPLEHQLRAIVRHLASEMGHPIRNDYLQVQRTGHYCLLVFIWPPGRPGRLQREEKTPAAFSFLIRPWLKRNLN